MPKDKHTPNPKVLSAFEAMIEGVPGIERKGDQNPYLSMNGNMYALMNKEDRFGIRLGKEDFETFLSTYDARKFEGVPGYFMREYVEVPEALYDQTEVLQDWFKCSHAYARTLKPKPTTKPKK